MATYTQPSKGTVVFLDRDGVINANRADYVKAWHEFRFLPGALEALRLLTEQGCVLFVVTNQAAINRGLVAQQTVEAMHRQMLAVIEDGGGRITAVRFCPHRPDEACLCRKPQPGMLQRLVAEYQINPFAAYMVGDALSDIAAGHAVGCRTILVQTKDDGGVAQHGPPEPHQPPDHVVASLLEAAHWIRHQIRQSAPL